MDALVICPICGMPPRDGEPCCTREYAKAVVRAADAKIRALTKELDELKQIVARRRPPTASDADDSLLF